MTARQKRDSAPPSVPSLEALRQVAASSSNALVAAIEACSVNITIADATHPDLPLIYVNPAFTRTTGYTAAEVLGRNCRFLQGPETDPEHVAALRSAIASERKVSVEMTNYRKDGTPFTNALTMEPVFDDAGQLMSFVGIQNDVTELRAQETQEIERQRLEALGQMAGGMSHQLNNLLQPILSLVSLHKPDIRDEAMAGDFETVLQCARQSADIAHEVLHFSRPGAGKREVLRVAETVRRNVAFVRSMLPSDLDVDVAVTPQSETCEVRLDATQFCQVLANLMINASQAMDGEGRITVGVETDGNDHVVVSISDTGPGIPPELRSRVFEPFYTTRSEVGGSGLGLSVAYSFVNGFDGKLVITDSYTNDINPGCRVNLYIPSH